MHLYIHSSVSCRKVPVKSITDLSAMELSIQTILYWRFPKLTLQVSLQPRGFVITFLNLSSLMSCFQLGRSLKLEFNITSLGRDHNENVVKLV